MVVYRICGILVGIEFNAERRFEAIKTKSSAKPAQYHITGILQNKNDSIGTVVIQAPKVHGKSQIKILCELEFIGIPYSACGTIGPFSS
jgi:hypothetical protein